LSARRRLHRFAVAVTALLPVVAAVPALAEPGDRESAEAALEAAFVLNFARYAEWPGERFDDDDAPIVVWVLGDARVAGALLEIGERAAPIEGRTIAVRTADPSSASPGEWNRLKAEVAAAHVLFVGSGVARDRARSLLAELADDDVLTVGNVPQFAADGGMLALAPERGRIAFDANPDAIRASRLKVSARVLKLARRLVTTDVRGMP
jgi:hypothetical protein